MDPVGYAKAFEAAVKSVCEEGNENCAACSLMVLQAATVWFEVFASRVPIAQLAAFHAAGGLHNIGDVAESFAAGCDALGARLPGSFGTPPEARA